MIVITWFIIMITEVKIMITWIMIMIIIWVTITLSSDVK